MLTHLLLRFRIKKFSANIDPTTVTDGSNADISSDLSSLTLTSGNNQVIITITSRFSGISPTTYTININLNDITPPVISNLQPVQDSFIMNANITYELSEDLPSGKVKFINTTDSTEEEVDLTGTELNSGVRSFNCINKCSNINSR